MKTHEVHQALYSLTVLILLIVSAGLDFSAERKASTPLPGSEYFAPAVIEFVREPATRSMPLPDWKGNREVLLAEGQD